MLSRALPRTAAWLSSAAALGLALLALWILRRWIAAISPGRGAGLVFGSCAAAGFAVAMLYPLRRRRMAWPLRDARDWHRLHVVAGTAALPCALLHEGLRLPAGWLGWLLLVLAAWSTIFGGLAVLLQRRLPARLVAGATEEIPRGRVDDAARLLREEADRLAERGSDAFAAWHQRELRPMFTRVHRSWRHVLSRDRAVSAAAVVPQLAPEDAEPAAKMLALVERKRSLDARASMQAALRYGVLVHVPTGILLIAVIAFHMFTVWYW
jgi:hypothetical protein